MLEGVQEHRGASSSVMISETVTNSKSSIFLEVYYVCCMLINMHFELHTNMKKLYTTSVMEISSALRRIAPLHVTTSKLREHLTTVHGVRLEESKMFQDVQGGSWRVPLARSHAGR